MQQRLGQEEHFRLGCVEGRAGDASSRPSAYKNSVTKFLVGILGCASASKADLSVQALAAACGVWGDRMENHFYGERVRFAAPKPCYLPALSPVPPGTALTLQRVLGWIKEGQ